MSIPEVVVACVWVSLGVYNIARSKHLARSAITRGRGERLFGRAGEGRTYTVAGLLWLGSALLFIAVQATAA